MKLLSTLITLCLIVSCTDDTRLCECVRSGEEVNLISASFFDGDFSTSRKDSLESAKEIRDSICAPFIDMDPSELKKAAKKCESLEIDTDSH